MGETPTDNDNCGNRKSAKAERKVAVEELHALVRSGLPEGKTLSQTL